MGSGESSNDTELCIDRPRVADREARPLNFVERERVTIWDLGLSFTVGPTLDADRDEMSLLSFNLLPVVAEISLFLLTGGVLIFVYLA